MARPALFCLVAGCTGGFANPQSAPTRQETVSIPGTDARFRLVLVPGGRFDAPGRQVSIRPFWIGADEVTWKEYALYSESWREAKNDGVTRPTQPDVINPRDPFPGGKEQSDRHPAVGIGWFGAMGYCDWLSKKTGRAYRLPTEAEWEYAARAGSKEPKPGNLDDVAWHSGTSGGSTHAVGSKKPNAWGLDDMLGNVMEHCLEPFDRDDSGGVVRGGAWNSPAEGVGFGLRQKVQMDKWLESDPKRPVRAWWLTDAPFVGLRLVRPEEDGASADERAKAMSSLSVAGVKIVRKPAEPYFFARVRGEIRYSGERALDEIELLVYFLDEEGAPLIVDPREKPTYNKCWPVLAHSFQPGPQAEPLAPGGTREFELEVPQPFDETGKLGYNRLGARVTRVHFAR